MIAINYTSAHPPRKQHRTSSPLNPPIMHYFSQFQCFEAQSNTGNGLSLPTLSEDQSQVTPGSSWPGQSQSNCPYRIFCCTHSASAGAGPARMFYSGHSYRCSSISGIAFRSLLKLTICSTLELLQPRTTFLELRATLQFAFEVASTFLPQTLGHESRPASSAYSLCPLHS